jgi:hypothetical protein
MVQPINYNLNVQTPFEAALGGMQIGATIADIRAKQQAQAIKAQQDQIAAQESQNNKANLTLGAQALSAIEAGNPDAAISLINSRRDAFRNSGDEKQANALDVWSQIMQMNPSVASKAIQRLLTTTPGGKELLEAAKIAGEEQRNADLHPSTLQTKQAEAEQKQVEAEIIRKTADAKISKEKSEAQKSAVAAKFAESKEVRELEKSGWDIKKIQSDIQIARQNVAIASTNAAIAREGNELKRSELRLKLMDLQDKRDQTVRDKAAEATKTAMQSDNLLNTVDGLMKDIVQGKDKKGNPIFSSAFRSAVGPLDERIITLQPDVANIEEAFKTLGSQITMSRIEEMKGALSNADLETLRASLQALSLRQSPDKIYKNLQEVQRLTLKARKIAFDKYGIPESRPDTPNVQPSSQEVDDILKKYGR